MRTSINRKGDTISSWQKGLFNISFKFEGHIGSDKVVRPSESGAEEYRLECNSEYADVKMGVNKSV